MDVAPNEWLVGSPNPLAGFGINPSHSLFSVPGFCRTVVDIIQGSHVQILCIQ